jgi:hypothetical protein
MARVAWMADQINELLASAIDTFSKAWVGSARWNAGEFDDVSIGLREAWGRERDLWVANLLSLVRTALLWPEDGPDATTAEGLPSWRQNIEQFKTNCAEAAEVAEMRILTVIHGDEEP